MKRKFEESSDNHKMFINYKLRNFILLKENEKAWLLVHISDFVKNYPNDINVLSKAAMITIQNLYLIEEIFLKSYHSETFNTLAIAILKEAEKLKNTKQIEYIFKKIHEKLLPSNSLSLYNNSFDYILNDLVEFSGKDFLEFEWVNFSLAFLDRILDLIILYSKNSQPEYYMNFFSQKINNETALQKLINNLIRSYFQKPDGSNLKIKLFFQTELLKRLLVHDKFSNLDSKKKFDIPLVVSKTTHLNNLFQKLMGMNYITKLTYFLLMKKYFNIIDLIIQSPFIRNIDYRSSIYFNKSYLLLMSSEEKIPKKITAETIILQAKEISQTSVKKIKYFYSHKDKIIKGVLPPKQWFTPQEFQSTIDAGEDPVRFFDIVSTCGFNPIIEEMPLLLIIAKKSIILLNKLVESKPMELLYGQAEGPFPLNSIYKPDHDNKLENQILMKLLFTLSKNLLNLFRTDIPKEMIIIIFSYLNLDVQPVFISKNLNTLINTHSKTSLRTMNGNHELSLSNQGLQF